jgi:hypothetical protein
VTHRNIEREVRERNRHAVPNRGASPAWALALAVFTVVVLALIFFTPGSHNVANKGSTPPPPSSSSPSVTTPPAGTTGTAPGTTPAIPPR